MEFYLTVLFILISWFSSLVVYGQKKTLVNVPVSVSDREGRYITNLKKSDFVVFQNGIKQEISAFSTVEEPLNVALLIDTSCSTEKVFGKIKDAAKEFVELLNPKDQCLIASFASQVNVLSDFTSNHSDLKERINDLKIDDEVGTVMRRAVNKLVKSSFSQVTGRKAIILLTDGKDFGSYMTNPELVEILQESDVMIYTVFYKTGVNINQLEKDDKKYEKLVKKMQKKAVVVSVPGADAEAPSIEEIRLREIKDDLKAIEHLKAISEATAGRFYLREATDLGKTFDEITDELRKQYRLGFYAANDGTEAAGNAALNEIKVTVSLPNAAVHVRPNFRQIAAQSEKK